MAKYKPYLDGVELREDAPEDVKQARETVSKWMDEQQGPLDQ